MRLCKLTQGNITWYHMAIREAFAEAWVWLEREGLLVLRPEQDKDIYFVSRRGMRLQSAADIEAYRRANPALPHHLLHPVLVQRVYAPSGAVITM